MMEALVAVGLASNVVQFVEFGSKLIHAYCRLRHGAQSEKEYHRTIINDLVPIASKVKSSAQTITHSATTLTSEQKALQLIADGCCELADKLIKRLDAYVVQSSLNGGRTRLPRAKIALKVIWEKPEVDEIVKQLEHLSKELHLRLTFELWQVQKSQALQLAKDDDVKAVLNKTSQLELCLKDLRQDIDEMRARQLDVLRAVSDIALENSKLHAQASQQSVFNQTAISTSIDDLRQMIQATHLESMSSLAQVDVKNSQFFATMTTDRESLERTIGSVLRPLMEEYKDLLLQETRKEFRGTARAHMEKLLAHLTQNIDLSDFSRNGENNETLYHEVTNNKGNTSQEQAYREKDETRENQRDQGHRANICSLYRSRYWKKTRIGKFWVFITRTIHFRPGQPPLAMYKLEAHFIPFVHWISTGCSIVYHKTADGRGPPTFGFQFPVYRVLAEDHEVYDTIAKGDTRAVQDMLLKKHILPSDRDDFGWTLLHWAAVYDRLEIARSLIQSGADVNAQNSDGQTPIAFAIMPSDISMIGKRYSVFHFLRSLSFVDMGSLWFDDNFSCLWPAYLYFCLIGQGVSNMVSDIIPNWLCVCRASEVNLTLNPLTNEDFIGTLFWYYISDLRLVERCGRTVIAMSTKWLSSPYMLDSRQYELIVRFVDSIIQQAPGYEPLQDSRWVPVAYYVAELCFYLDEGLDDEPTDIDDCLDNLIVHRGYYVSSVAALQCLKLAEYVISAGIKQRPDCIFDSYEGITICDGVEDAGYEGLWNQLLEEHGIDPGWARNENERRKRMGTGDTSALDVSIKVDASKIMEVTKRKPFISEE
ncbi:hypothetical protein F5Y01DRAFT_100486 [Xylaria sp. FL0043]|nr:hypothetical protein F5Y01DRAFT_100486 [Xylaria sp. FL0043]